MKTLDGFDLREAEGIGAKLVPTSPRCDWVKDAKNVLFVGPIGTDKTHLAIALASRRRASATTWPWRAALLVRTFVEARDQRELSRLQRRLLRVEVLILDELGFVPIDRTGGELLFNVIADRNGRKKVMLTSNVSFPVAHGVCRRRGTHDDSTALPTATVITPKGKRFRMRRRGQTHGAQNEADGPERL